MKTLSILFISFFATSGFAATKLRLFTLECVGYNGVTMEATKVTAKGTVVSTRMGYIQKNFLVRPDVRSTVTSTNVVLVDEDGSEQYVIALPLRGDVTSTQRVMATVHWGRNHKFFSRHSNNLITVANCRANLEKYYQY